MLMCIWPSAIVLTVVNYILYKNKTAVGNVKWYSILEKTLASSLKTKHTLILQPSNHSPGHLSQRNENLCPHKDMMVHWSLTCNSLKLETTKVSYNRLMIK